MGGWKISQQHPNLEAPDPAEVVSDARPLHDRPASPDSGRQGEREGGGKGERRERSKNKTVEQLREKVPTVTEASWGPGTC